MPAHASVLSAVGLMTAPLRVVSARTELVPIAALEPGRLDTVFEELQTDASERLGPVASEEAVVVERLVAVRYVGQWHELSIPFDANAERLAARFEDEHERLYGTRLGDPVEIVECAVALTVTEELPDSIWRLSALERPAASDPSPRFVYLADEVVPVHARSALAGEIARSVHRRGGAVGHVGAARSDGAARRRPPRAGARGVTVARLDAFSLEILRSYLVSSVREMVATTTRTAYSTCFAHGEDFTCGLFDARGRLIAQDQGVPVHAGALGDAVGSVIENAGRIEPGDVFVHNDPYSGGTHQADGLICRPIFAAGVLAGFAANRGHWTDIGGMAPGGWSGSAEDVNQEALLIPAVRLFSRGEVVEDVRRMILRNVRLPVQLWGDIQAQIASNVVAERRIAGLSSASAARDTRASSSRRSTTRRRRFLSGLEQVADGVAEARDVIEDDGRGGGPLTIAVRVEKTPGRRRRRLRRHRSPGARARQLDARLHEGGGDLLAASPSSTPTSRSTPASST